MKTRGVSFRHAVELLRDDHPSLAAGDGRVVRKGTTVKLASPVTADADDQQTLREVVSFYHQTLQESPEALRYLESRGLRHPEMTGHFQIGFANRKLGLTLPDKNRTMATLMHEGGADIRYIQAMLGHADLKTTEIYTHVAIRLLQEIHRATHPAKLKERKPPRTMRRNSGGVPRQLRSELIYAAAAANAWLRGLSVPCVALHYRYEPLTALNLIARVFAGNMG
jgi:hypothetical protein